MDGILGLLLVTIITLVLISGLLALHDIRRSLGEIARNTAHLRDRQSE